MKYKLLHEDMFNMFYIVREDGYAEVLTTLFGWIPVSKVAAFEGTDFKVVFRKNDMIGYIEVDGWEE